MSATTEVKVLNFRRYKDGETKGTAFTMLRGISN